VEDLATCSYSTEAFSDLLGKIQASVCLSYSLSSPLSLSHTRSLVQIDKLNLEGYANLENWVAELDKRIEKILLQRLGSIIEVWCAEFDRNEDGESKREGGVPVLSNVRDMGGKRRNGKSGKEDKVVDIFFFGEYRLMWSVGYGNADDCETYCA